MARWQSSDKTLQTQRASLSCAAVGEVPGPHGTDFPVMFYQVGAVHTGDTARALRVRVSVLDASKASFRMRSLTDCCAVSRRMCTFCILKPTWVGGGSVIHHIH